MRKYDLGWWQQFSDTVGNVLTRGLNQRGQKHAPFIISLFEGRKHVIFPKNNNDN